MSSQHNELENMTRDELLEALKQMHAAKQESSSAIAQPVHHTQEKLFKIPIKWFLSWKLFVSFLMIMLVTGATLWVSSTDVTEDKTASLTEQIHELATLTTAEAHVKTILEQEDYKLFGKDITFRLPGTYRKILIVVPATVIAGVDLKGVTANDVKIMEDTNELHIKVPHATLVQEPSIKMEEVQTFSSEGIFRSDVNWEEGFQYAAEAKQLIKEEAIDAGLLTSAEENAKKVLGEFFRNLGYEVVVTFK